MSYQMTAVFRPSPGVSFQSFVPGSPLRKFPTPNYSPNAAGPAYLSTDGLGAVIQQTRSQVPWNLSGLGQLGLDLTAVVSQLQATLDGIVQGVINRNWPTVDKHMSDSLAPVKYMLIGATAASAAAAAMSYLAWQK